MDTILHDVLVAVGTALAPIVAALVTGLLVQLLRKWNLEISAEHQAKLQMAVREAVIRAEEWAARQRKLPPPAQPVFNDKLSFATVEISKAYPRLDPAAIEMLIMSELPKVGLGASLSGFRQTPEVK